jgi:hypothetical protein
MDRLRYYLQIIDWKFIAALVALGVAVKLVLMFV